MVIGPRGHMCKTSVGAVVARPCCIGIRVTGSDLDKGGDARCGIGEKVKRKRKE